MKKAKFGLCLLAALLILLRPEASVSGAQQARRLWCASVAPALFPFLALMPMLTGPEACRAYERAFAGIMERLFRLPGSAAPALAVGMIAGSPGGAIAVSRVAAQEALSRNQAHRLALSLAGFSPAYLLLGVGTGLYGSRAMGWKLIGIQAAVQLILLAVLRSVRLAGDEPSRAEPGLRAGGMAQAVESVLAICGYMVLFGALSSVAASIVGEKAGALLHLIADLPGGLAGLAGKGLPSEQLLACAGIGFGGLCIAAQNVDALKGLGVSMKEYLSVRALASALFAGIGGIVLREAPQKAAMEGSALASYAFSLLFACAASIPAMIFLTKNIYLNNSK